MKDQGHRTAVVASAVTLGARQPEGVKVIDLGGSGARTLSTLRPLAQALRRLAPSTVFAHAEGPARAAFVATRGMRPLPQLIGISHNHYSSHHWSYPRARRLLDGLLLPRLDALVGVSPGVAEDLMTTFGAAAAKVKMIPPPLTRWHSLADLAAQPVDHTWFDGTRPVILTVGHVHARKDHQTLIRALAELRTGDGVLPRLVIIGSDAGPYAEQVRALVSELGLEDQVMFMGMLDNPMPYVAAADAFVLSSRNEGLPVVLLEAMALGTPVISTDAPSGPRWLLDDGQIGLLAPVGDATALAMEIDRLLSDRVLRERLTEAGLRRVRAFSPERIGRAYLDLAAGL